MITKILLVLALLAIVFVTVVALQSSEFHTERSITLAAQPSAAFDEVNDLHRFQEWNPWAKVDPAMKSTYNGPAAGFGAIYTWAGNTAIGEGRMTIVESRPAELVRLKMEFLKPMVSTSTAEFTFKAEGDQTVVTWSMFGERNFPAKAIGLFINMDKMIGEQFEKGLADLKQIVENNTAKVPVAP